LLDEPVPPTTNTLTIRGQVRGDRGVGHAFSSPQNDFRAKD
jgi:hypothetical protein